MIKRCHRKTNHNYQSYGGRGIHVQEIWHRNGRGFIEYIETTLGGKPTPQHTLDRIDNDRNYEEGNLRWASLLEQNNNKSNNHLLTHDGETLTVPQWGRKLGISQGSIKNRIRLGWSDERILTTPVRSYKKSHV